MSRLDGKVAVVTGGARGIGLATGTLFVEEGARVLLVDVEEELLKKAVETLGSDRAGFAVADVSNPEQSERYVKVAVEHFGGIDIYIANAGILGPVVPIVEFPIDVFDRVMAVNVRGVWLGLKYTMPEIAKRKGGSIVITSSIAGVKGFGGISGYSTSKHALVGLMRTAAIEGAPIGIRVNAIHPGPIETPMIDELADGIAPGSREQGRQALEGATLLKRAASAREVANIMLFLASDDAAFCTGGSYMVDGGNQLG
ncbi:MAG: SDR family NAD(P)-dependent oxidoreductase [Syntrophorhabdales bacterium]|jgi:NAD(P)-dependent dehydrogenase (short-subunit alcohol dehydrogenase family)